MSNIGNESPYNYNTKNINDLITEAESFKAAKVDYAIDMAHLDIGGRRSEYPDMIRVPAGHRNLIDIFDPNHGKVNPAVLPLTETAAKQLAAAQGWPAAARMVGDMLLPKMPGMFGEIVRNAREIEGHGTYARNGAPKQMLLRSILPIDGYYNEHTIRTVKGGQYEPFDGADVLWMLKHTMDTLGNTDGHRLSLEGVRREFGGNAFIEPIEGKPPYTLYHAVHNPDRYDYLVRVNAWVYPDDGHGALNRFMPAMYVRSNDITGASIQTGFGGLRGACLNTYRTRVRRSDIKGQDKWNPAIAHRGSHENIAVELQKAIAGALYAGAELAQKMVVAQLDELQKPHGLLGAVLGSILSEENYDEAMANAGIGMEGQTNTWGLLNGLTYTAQHSNIPVEHRTTIEEFAGTTLNRIDSALENGHVTDKSIARLFSRVLPEMAELEEEAEW